MPKVLNLRGVCSILVCQRLIFPLLVMILKVFSKIWPNLVKFGYFFSNSAEYLKEIQIPPKIRLKPKLSSERKSEFGAKV